MRRQTLLQALAAVLITGTAGMAPAQQVVVQPTQGQSSSQMEKDKGDCYTIAKQSTGYDPALAAQTSSAATTAPPTGGRVRGAAAGAVGAQVRSNQYENVPDKAKEEYRQNQAKSAAAAGAVVGGSKQRRDRRQESTQQQQTAAQQSSNASAFNQAYSACLTGRGYQVTQ
jgi:hypothetical protein